MYICQMESIEKYRSQFIQEWASMSSAWGINKAMAQIHAFLLLHPEPQHMEYIMQSLAMSRGNVSMNLKLLIDWGLVEKCWQKGDRRDYFKCEHDIFEMTLRIARERRKREVYPALKLLSKSVEMELIGEENEIVHMQKICNDMLILGKSFDAILALFENHNKTDFEKMLENIS